MDMRPFLRRHRSWYFSMRRLPWDLRSRANARYKANIKGIYILRLEKAHIKTKLRVRAIAMVCHRGVSRGCVISRGVVGFVEQMSGCHLKAPVRLRVMIWDK